MSDIKEDLLELILDTGALSREQIAEFQSNQEKFGNAFVINMKNRPERLEEATKTLSKVNIIFERFIAIDGKKCEKDKKWKNFCQRHFPKLRPEESGCLLSHLSILALAATHPNKNNFTMIFEDDIVTSLTASIDPTLRKIAHLDEEKSIDLIYLGKCLETCTKMKHLDDNIYLAHSPSCAHAYAIKNSFACRLLDDLDKICNAPSQGSHPFNRGIDGIYKWYIEVENHHKKIRAVVVHPAIFFQDVLSGGSDLRKEFLKNYLECIDTDAHANKKHHNNEKREEKHDKDRKDIQKKGAENKHHAGGIITLFVLIFMIAVFVAIIMLADKKNQKLLKGK